EGRPGWWRDSGLGMPGNPQAAAVIGQTTTQSATWFAGRVRWRCDRFVTLVARRGGVDVRAVPARRVELVAPARVVVVAVEQRHPAGDAAQARRLPPRRPFPEQGVHGPAGSLAGLQRGGRGRAASGGAHGASRAGNRAPRRGPVPEGTGPPGGARAA